MLPQVGCSCMISYRLQLHFEQRRRSTCVSANRRCLGAVPKPALSFRMRFVQAFRIRSLRELFARNESAFSIGQKGSDTGEAATNVATCTITYSQWYFNVGEGF
uniref:AlNc14C177G8146 protein n=1 Tax=Albugo laibachii Nc14 TaxID=890382 RepID=F0WNZ2_9STRA|nr:AlNc14C177G8146 [Albugo laibachii Nc14]|eukprot:CCA23035.1 AlNc14C177G8146 [Albugo laibachii Nc14]